MRYFSTAVRTDYLAYGNPDIQRFIFGGDGKGSRNIRNWHVWCFVHVRPFGDPWKGSNQDTYFIVEKDFNGNDQDCSFIIFDSDGNTPDGGTSDRPEKLWKALGLVDARSLFPQTYTAWKIPSTFTVSILFLIISWSILCRFFKNRPPVRPDLRQFRGIFGRFLATSNSKSSWFTWDSDWCHGNPSFWFIGSITAWL